MAGRLKDQTIGGGDGDNQRQLFKRSAQLLVPYATPITYKYGLFRNHTATNLEGFGNEHADESLDASQCCGEAAHIDENPACHHIDHLLLLHLRHFLPGSCIHVSLHLESSACVAEVPKGRQEASQDAKERQVQGRLWTILRRQPTYNTPI